MLNSMIYLDVVDSGQTLPAYSLKRREGRGHEPVERGRRGGMGLVQVEQSCVCENNRAPAPDGASSEDSLAGKRTIGFPGPLDESTRQTDRYVRPARPHQGVFARATLVEFEGEAPMIEDRRQKDYVLRAPPVADGKPGFSCQHRIGEQEQPATRAHPGVESDVLGRAQRARLREHEEIELGEGFLAQDIERTQPVVLLDLWPGPVSLAATRQHLAKIARFSPVDGDRSHQADFGPLGLSRRRGVIAGLTSRRQAH